MLTLDTGTGEAAKEKKTNIGMSEHYYGRPEKS